MKVTSKLSTFQKTMYMQDLNRETREVVSLIKKHADTSHVKGIAERIEKSTVNAESNKKYHESLLPDVSVDLLWRGPLGVYETLVKNLDFSNGKNPIADVFSKISNTASREEELTIKRFNRLVKNLSEMAPFGETVKKLNNLITGAEIK